MKRTALFMTLMLLLGATKAAAVADNYVEIAYNGTTATVTVASNISNYVTVSSGTSSHVKITQSDAVGATTGEIFYTLSGTSSDGEFYLEGSYKSTVILAGLTLNNPAGPAINIQNGKRIDLSVKNGTTNTLTDGANADYNGCFHCKGHTKFKGKGTLNITGNSRHAIYSKEYVEIKNCTINIDGAVKDGIHCQQYLLMESGNVSIKNVQDDGIQVELKGTESTGEIKETATVSAHEDEDSGNFYMTDGTLAISSYGGKAIKTDGDITISGGTQDFPTADTQTYATTITTAIADSAAAVTAVYTPAGQRLPASAAQSALRSKGLYIVKKSNGTTTKVLVR